MKRYRITLEIIVEAKTPAKAEKIATRMLDAVDDHLISAAIDPIEEATQ